MVKRIPAPVRFAGVAAALIVIFGACSMFLLGAMDIYQTSQTGNLFNPTVLLSHTLHFLQQTWYALTIATDRAGVPYHEYLLLGVGLTIEFCFISMPLALILGFVLAMMSRSRARWLRTPARAFVEFFRNTPLLVQMLAIYSALIFLPPSLLNAFTAGVATLVLNYAAYECENIRAGLEAIDIGQSEAAQVLGLSQLQTTRLIIVPQMIPIILPPVMNDLIYMYKDSSILSLITVIELTQASQNMGHNSPNLQWQAYLLAGAIYLLLSLPLARLARWVEGQIKSSRLGARTDLTSAALLTLGVMVLVGLFCGVLEVGLTFGNIVDAFGELIAAIGLSVAIMVFMMALLGGLVGIPQALWLFIRRPHDVDSGAAEGQGQAGSVAVMPK